MPHLESKTKLIMTASVNWYINPIVYNDNTDNLRGNQLPAALKEYHVSVNWYISPFYFRQQLRSILMSIFGNSRSIFLFELEECAAHWQLKTK